MKDSTKPVVWRGRSLGGARFIMRYQGRVYVRPIGRGICLLDLELAPALDDILDSGHYQVEFRVLRRLESKDAT